MKILPKGIIEKCTRTVGDKNEIDEVMRPTLIVQGIFGHQILNPHWTLKKYLPQLLATVLLLVYIIFGTLEIINNTNDVKLIAEAMYTFLIMTLMPTKLFFFVIVRDDFQKLYAALKTTLYQSIKDDSEDTLRVVLKKTKNLVNFLLLVCFFPVLIYFLVVLWFYVNGERVTMSKTTSILMPMRTPYHEIGFILHSVFMFEAAFTIVAVDIWFVVMMIILCSSCDATVKNLTVEEKKSESRLEYANRLNKSLKRFYKAHVHEIEFLYLLNKMFKWLALFPLISVALCVCIILLTMSKGIDLAFVTNLLPPLCELFIYNWYGEQLKNKADYWKEALLNFDWTNLLAKDKKCYYIIVCYMQRNFGIRTANGTDLSLVTMTATLKFSYQAFTMLQTMDV